MLSCYLRSSNLSAYEWCPWKFFLASNLGLPDPAGLSAQKGSCVHKALELLARKKLAQQNAQKSFRDDELAIIFFVDRLTPEVALEEAYGYYSNPIRTEQVWTEGDHQDCLDWMNAAIEWGDGMFDPSRRTIVVPEQYFDIAVKRPWATYDYQVRGQRVRGQLHLKGTMDLVTRLGPGVIEYVDWKTGQRKNWSKNRPKDYQDFLDDKQFLLYYYVLRHLYPDDNVMFTVFYNRDGGPFTIPFGDHDLFRAEEMLRESFETIRADEFPAWVKPSWKCKICNYSKQTPTGSVCENTRKEFVELGMTRFLDRHADLDGLQNYGQGGGRSNRDTN